VSAARLLKDQGMTVAVVEARRVGQGVSGKATAKVTSQHGIIYQTLEKKFGENRARLYAEAQEAGLRKIIELSRVHGFDADIEAKPAFVYTREERHVEDIEKEVELARRLGLPANLTRDTGLPFDMLAAMRWEDQAQFHPIKYVAGLAATIPGGGSHVFENSRVTDWDPRCISTGHGVVRARYVVLATNLPLGQVGLYYATNYPMAEPVIATPISCVPPAYYKNVEQPAIRSARTDTTAAPTPLLLGRTSSRVTKTSGRILPTLSAGSQRISGRKGSNTAGSTRIIPRWTARRSSAGPHRTRTTLISSRLALAPGDSQTAPLPGSLSPTLPPGAKTRGSSCSTRGG
jgi:glycine/D-amino acid oxidase-like deaminating enzyme